MGKYCLQALLIEPGPFTRIAQIVGDQVETLCLSCTMAGKINDDCVFGFRALEAIEQTCFQRWWCGRSRQSQQRRQDICLGRVSVN